MSDLGRLLTLQDANTRTVLLGVGALGVAAGVVGCFATLRRRALLGDAIAHASLPGVCAAFFIVHDRSFAAFMCGAMLFGALAAATVAAIRTLTRVREDAAIALVIGSFFGLGIVWSSLIQQRPGGAVAGLDGFLFGKAASMVASDARAIVIVAAAVLTVVGLLFKELKSLSFDAEFTRTQGWPTLALDLLVMGLVCACTVAGLPAVGVVMIIALLIIPGAAARCWTDRLGLMLALAGLFGFAAAVLGAALSATLPAPALSPARGWPTGPLIVLCAAAFFLASAIVAPRRGLIARMRAGRAEITPP